MLFLAGRLFDFDRRLRDGLDDLALLLELLDASVDEAVEVAERGGDEAEQLRERRDDRTDELTAQDVDRRERREPVDLLSRQRLPLEDPATEREHVRLLRGGRERLRDGGRVARRLDERDRGRALEHHEQRIGSGLLRGASGQRVLDDPKACAVRQQLIPQRLELLVREAAVVGDDERLRRSEIGCELVDDPFLVRFQHVVSS